MKDVFSKNSKISVLTEEVGEVHGNVVNLARTLCSFAETEKAHPAQP